MRTAKECQALLESMQERLPIDVLVGKKNLGRCPPGCGRIACEADSAFVVQRSALRTPTKARSSSACSTRHPTSALPFAQEMTRPMKVRRRPTDTDPVGSPVDSAADLIGWQTCSGRSGC